MRAVLNSFAEYQIGFGNEFYIKSMSGYNIKSTSFRISGISQDIYYQIFQTPIEKQDPSFSLPFLLLIPLLRLL